MLVFFGNHKGSHLICMKRGHFHCGRALFDLLTCAYLAGIAVRASGFFSRGQVFWSAELVMYIMYDCEAEMIPDSPQEFANGN